MTADPQQLTLELPNQETAATHIYVWGNNERRAELKGRHCKIITAGRMNSVLVEFTDNGERVNTSRRAIRQLDPEPAGFHDWMHWLKKHGQGDHGPDEQEATE